MAEGMRGEMKRDDILAIIYERPGQTTTQISKKWNEKIDSLASHLNALRKKGYIRSKNEGPRGGYTWYIHTGSVEELRDDILGALEQESLPPQPQYQTVITKLNVIDRKMEFGKLSIDRRNGKPIFNPERQEELKEHLISLKDYVEQVLGKSFEEKGWSFQTETINLCKGVDLNSELVSVNEKEIEDELNN